MAVFRALLLLAGLLLLGLAYLPGGPNTVPAGLVCCSAALGLPLITALD